MNPILRENKIELCDAYYNESSSGYDYGWVLPEDLRNARFSLNLYHPEVKEILERIELERQKTNDFIFDDMTFDLNDDVESNLCKEVIKKKYIPKKISSKK